LFLVDVFIIFFSKSNPASINFSIAVSVSSIGPATSTADDILRFFVCRSAKKLPADIVYIDGMVRCFFSGWIVQVERYMDCCGDPGFEVVSCDFVHVKERKQKQYEDSILFLLSNN
jgi:hypothetical protein